MDSEPHRKRVKHFHQPGDFHELTFSCYRRKKLLANDRWRGYLARNIDAALLDGNFQLTAFVFMPEHVHLLVLPLRTSTAVADISRFLAHLKEKTSRQVKADLVHSHSRLLDELTIRDRPNSASFRYWQEGPGYDRNLQQASTVLAAIDYIHLNPVRRNLVAHPGKWRWSSARWYLSDCQEHDSAWPQLTPPPPELFLPNL